MGQLVGVLEKPSTRPGVVRFELNRSLTGMGHERYTSSADADGSTPGSVLAQLLFGTGRVAEVHIYANIVTVVLERGFDPTGLAGVIEGMYRYWKPGVEPPSFDDLQPDEPAAAAAPSGDGGDELSEAAKKVPAHLLERSRAARERWKAKHG